MIQFVTDLLFQKASQVRIRFQDVDSRVTESAEQSLLRRRVLAATIVLLLAKSAFATRSIFLVGRLEALDGLLLGGLLAATFWLWWFRNMPMFWLRVVEVAAFLGLSVQLGLLLHEQLRAIADNTFEPKLSETDRAIRFVAAVKDQIVATFGLMMIYGMFIPNTPLRASAIVVLMAIIPGVILSVNEGSVEAIIEFRRAQVAVSGLLSSNLLALAVGAGCAIYGTSVMNRWRTRALEAEQLGQYRIQKKIGAGGMGDVYLAEHRLLKRQCAVKLIRADLSEDPVMLTRFEREVQATATLTHWNTVQVFDYGQTADGTFFYVMEHLDGCNLRQVVSQFGPLRDARVIFIMRQVCEALREAAARDLVHRDIKPSNIFLSRLGERCDVVKLLDFGLVRPLGSMSNPDLSATNELRGSPRYMCPEQAQGQTPDCRGDIYSLGATAFYMLAGRPPFHQENALQLVIAHATEKAPSLADVGAVVNPQLAAIVARCLQKNPADRFQTADEMLQALDDVQIDDVWTWQHAEQWWSEHDDIITGRAVSIGTPESTAADLDETVIASSATT